ncbi:hypothetical protein BCS37_03860 [Selenomonas sp. oral taxon 920]|uniref:TonB-dependent receptor n=1 Tax=Selenomonas sp. oral taxon 920 TaxID=1884263 RepID=UPI000840F2B8|nr:TonB-dependent receptor [Selenomonas sp. oral taxon 920]AOH47631.1 hypothetical protein BCS37_03860 [Selenomonas sp. oral taxon 920]
MTKEKKWTLAVLAAFAGASFVGTAYAAEQASTEQTETHALSDTVVTAQRREKRDLDTPATTTIITAKEIEKAGYRNVFEAIDQQIGSTSTSYGEAEQDIPDKLQLNMNVIYTAGKDDVVSLGIYNLLNRENYSNRYGNLDLGRNFRLTYTHAF